MSTEKERIKAEELVYTEDYLSLIDTLVQYSEKTYKREFDSLMRDLTKALHEKVAFNLNNSSKYRKKLGFFASLREKREAKKEAERLLAEYSENKKQQPADKDVHTETEQCASVVSPNFKALSEFSQNSALLESKDKTKLIENSKNTNTQDEGQCMSF